MGKNTLLTLLVVLGLGAGFFYVNSKKSQDSSSVAVVADDTKEVVMEMGEDEFIPQNIEVKKGTKVIFKNVSDTLKWPASNLHPSHLIYPEFDPKAPVGKGESWEFTFDKVGEWEYHDHLSPYISGLIKVTE